MMKKLIAALIAVLCALTLFACASGEKSSDYWLEKDVEATDASGTRTWTVCAGASAAKLINDNGDEYALEYTEIDALSADFLRPEFIDLNFDGTADFCMRYISSDTGAFKFYRWIYNADEGQFVQNTELSSLGEITVDADTKTITSTVDYGYAGKYQMYLTWSDGALYASDVILINPEEIAAMIITDLYGADSGASIDGLAGTVDNFGISDGKISFGELECGVYQIAKDGKTAGYLAVDSSGQWYVDEGCTGTYYTLAYMLDKGFYIYSIRYVADTSTLTSLTVADIAAYEGNALYNIYNRIYCVLSQNAEAISTDIDGETIAAAVAEKISGSDTINDDTNIFALVCLIYGIDSTPYLEADGVEYSFG